MELQSGSHISLFIPLTALNTVYHVDGNMHGNYMQIRLCIVKLGIESAIYGDFWEESGWRCTKCTHTQNLTFVHMYTFRVKSMESFINETPWCV